jgi:hypothetical protein
MKALFLRHPERWICRANCNNSRITHHELFTFSSQRRPGSACQPLPASGQHS